MKPYKISYWVLLILVWMGIQWNDSRIGIETTVFADFTAIPNGGGTMRYAGPFTNTTLGLSGSVYLDIQVEPTTVSGYINFTDGPDVSGVLCGANSFSGARSGNTFQFSFVSDDPEPGCSITDGLTFNVSGTISGNEIINGSFSVPSLGQSGTFSAKQTLRRNGRFINDTLTADGDVYVDLALWDSSIAGYINFTGDPGDGALCGANSFTGSRNGSAISFAFRSSDPDAGCQIVDDMRFDLTGTLSENNIINGTYYVPDVSQGGTFYANGHAIDTTPPGGNITSPTADANIGGGPHTISANATDNNDGTGVSYVDFYVKYDGTWHFISTDPTSPYTAQWQTPSSLQSQQLQLAIHVVDKSGNVTYNAGGYVPVNFIESLGEPIQENWVPQDRRAYLNQRSLSPNGDIKCGAASAAMVMAMNGVIGQDYNSMATKANQIYVPYNPLRSLWQSLQNNGLVANYGCVSADSAWGTITAEIDAGRPIIVLSNKITIGHYFVVVGYREVNETREIIVYDPYGRWTGTYNQYDRNTTAPESYKGRWVYYDFNAVWGYSSAACTGGKGYILTAHLPNALEIAEQLNGGGLTAPDLISDEPSNIDFYAGEEIFADSQLFLPAIISK